MQVLLTLIEQYGLWLVFANVFALQFGLPVPAYPTLIVAGAIAARGGIEVPQVMCKLSLSPDSCVRQTESIYERWGAPSLMVAKFIPGFAAVATSMAGTVRTPLWRFALIDAFGCEGLGQRHVGRHVAHGNFPRRSWVCSCFGCSCLLLRSGRRTTR